MSRRAAPAIIGAAVAGMLLALYKPFPIGVAQDDGLYMILAKAISTGQGYRFINLPGAPAGVHYPPGYPLLLAALSRLTSGIPGNPLVFAAANMVFLGVGAAFLYLLARRAGIGTGLAVGCALAGFLMPPAIWMNTALFSEPMWLGLAIPWLVWADSAERGDESMREPRSCSAAARDASRLSGRRPRHSPSRSCSYSQCDAVGSPRCW